MMRSLSIVVLMVLAMSPAVCSAGDPPLAPSPADDDTVASVTRVVSRHFRAMRSGNCQGLRRDLTPEFFQVQHGSLCANNRDYGEFLREQHQNTTIEVNDVVQQGDDSVVCTVTLMKNGAGVDRVQLRLRRVGKGWKIAGVLS